MTTDSSGRNARLDRLADEFAERYRCGERPSLQEYIDRYPDLADEIRELFPALVEIEQGKEDRRAADEPPPAGPSAPPEQIGDFHILREIGRGGMGIVYEAEQVSLGRHVALKVLPGHARHDPRQLQRFEREARAAAKLHHTNIVPVFGVGEQDGLHYYVMQFIQGLGLDQVLTEVRRLRQAGVAPSGQQPLDGKEAQVVSAVAVAQSLLTGQFVGDPTTGGGRQHRDGSPDRGGDAPPVPASASSVHLPGQAEGSSLSETGRSYWNSVARIGIQVAEALDYANGQGILHRDVKPANLLLDTRGTVWVTDFGLAKPADGEDLTHTGDVVGTMRYLAPERFQGKADARSDVYALGLTLYELLTLRSAFDETDRNKLLAQVMRAEPPRPRQLCPEVPHDLETIVLKATEKEPGRRYPTAKMLAEDLRRFLGGSPILARPTPTWERLWKWARRRPAETAVVLVSGVAVLALVGLGVGLGYHRKLQEAYLGEAEARREAQDAYAQLEALQYFNRITLAQAEWRDGNVLRVTQLLADCLPRHRNWEWHYFQRLCHADLFTLEADPSRVECVRFSPDGSRLAAACADATVKVWDVTTGQKVLTLPDHGGRAESVAFSPDGSRLASADVSGVVRVWDAATGLQLLACKGHQWVVWSVAFSPDGKRLASAGRDGTVKVWDGTTGQQRLELSDQPGEVYCVAFRPDGSQLVSCGEDGTVKLWDAVTGQHLLTLAGHTKEVGSVAFSPDGTRLASASVDRTVKVWDLTPRPAAGANRLIHTLTGHTNVVRGVAFSPDGTRLASASFDQTVKVWDAMTGREHLTVRGHTASVRSVTFSPDGSRLASAGADGAVKVWDGTTPPESLTLTGQSVVSTVAFRPDGKQLASAGADKTVRLWDVETGQLSGAFTGHSGEVRSVAFRPDGRQLASADEDGTVKVWDVGTGRLSRTLIGHTDRVNAVAYGPDGARLASAGTDGTVKVWDVGTGQLIHTLTGLTRSTDPSGVNETSL
jgi:WD40 repeat protein/serine/threonine protein kinase